MLEGTFYAESIIINGMGFADVRKVFTALDPGMGLSSRRKE